MREGQICSFLVVYTSTFNLHKFSIAVALLIPRSAGKISNLSSSKLWHSGTHQPINFVSIPQCSVHLQFSLLQHNITFLDVVSAIRGIQNPQELRKLISKPSRNVSGAVFVWPIGCQSCVIAIILTGPRGKRTGDGESGKHLK